MKGIHSVRAFAPWLEGFAGVSLDDGLFGTPEWVDKEKAPGHTSQAKLLGLQKTLSKLVTLSYFFYSPNLVWFAMALAKYLAFPYDVDAASRGWAWGWVLKNLLVNFVTAFVYYGFWHWSLYVRRWSQRKFKPGSFPTFENMCHNLWYWSLGVLQWSLTESLMTRLWATGKIPYVSDAEVLASPKQQLILAFWVLLVPQWRDIHFYFAHRFSHIRAFYKYVHALHHRNTDPEPFSGLCMHPVEHLVYFSNALAPAVYLSVSPFVVMWTFMHLGIAPGAGHSGWEDHWQSDQYHYIHHAKFECNYGSPSSGWIDQLFGTFREKLGSSDAYKGEYKQDYEAKAGAVWSAQGVLGLQRNSHLAYTLFCLAATGALVWAAVLNPLDAQPVRIVAGLPLGPAMGALIAYGPVAFALLLCAQFDKMSWRWPFHKDRIIGSFGLFLLTGWAACLQPIFDFTRLACTP